jgi:hypothetical protein
VKLNEGYPNRFKFEANWVEGELDFDAIKKELISQKTCVEKYTATSYDDFAKDEFCLIENVNLEATALLLADSHANHLYSGLVINKELTGGNLLNRGSGSCFPFFDNPANPNAACPMLIDKLLEMAIASPSIKTVILAGKAVTKLNEERFIPKGLGSTSKNENDPYLIFEKGMKKTLQRLTAANKKIVFILDTPDLEFRPSECKSRRPWRLKEQIDKSPCAVPRSQVDFRRKKYLEIVTPILNEFPNVKVLDPLPTLCDKNYCWAIKDKKMLYRDPHHLNETGAIYLGEYFFHSTNLK